MSAHEFQSAQRLIPQISAEDEWSYLVNETLIGEKCIVPLLQEILLLPQVTGRIRESLQRQFDEEVDHVRLYFGLVGADRLPGSGYDGRLKEYVKSLPKVSLRLFALQGMLEGIALGALEHRIRHWTDSPSFKTDVRAKIEEQGHVACSFSALEELIRIEGPAAPEEFRRASRDINSFFLRAFSGDGLVEFAASCGRAGLDPRELDSTAAIRAFRSQSVHTLVENRGRFLARYREASLSAAS